ncbi:MAG TPA: sulfite exporter TauE/SafE family protein, partial [Nitrososphaeraceae archaeon]
SINSLFNSILMLNQHNIAAIASVFHQPVSILAVIPIQQTYTPLTILLSLISGAIVGFSLGLIGGGGSILAVPLLLYVVGITDAHIAIGTSALAVGVNALTNMVHHYKRGYVKIKEGLRFAIPGVAGTILGSQLGLLTPSNSLLILFGIFMIIISVRMLRQSTKVKGIKIKNSTTTLVAKDNVSIMENNPNYDDDKTDKNNRFNNMMNNSSKNEDKSVNVLADDSDLYDQNNNTNKLLKLLATGFLVGLAAGYFGIGGGFIIVPSLMHLGLNIIDAIGTSLIPVSMFGYSTAIRYSFNNQIEWVIALLFIGGGIGGGILGTKFASKLPKKTLSMAFAFLLIIVAVYIISKSVLLVV